MKIDPHQLTRIIQEKIEAFKEKVDIAKIGVVLRIGDGIAQVYGLKDALSSELLIFPHNVYGMVLNLEEETVGACIFGDDSLIKEGDEVRLTGKVLEVPVGEALVGRVVDPLGNPLDDGPKIKESQFRPVEVKAPGVAQREPVNTPLETGIKAIDAMIPIGRGQRELIIGDRQTGKTALLIDTIINQKGKGVLCFYVAIGQRNSTVATMTDTLKKYGCMEYTTVVVASASSPTPLQYIAPYAATSMAEYFRDKGEDVVVMYDDLSKHAACYRELSLLLRRPPGREAYPGDIFYTHSRLLERACKLNKRYAGGSLTALPVVETQAQDVTTYIPTNLISITDGQIYLDTDLFHQGVMPAINVGLSVSRVGGAAQFKAIKKVSGMLRLDLAQFREVEAFTQLGTELDKETTLQIERGRHLVEALKQAQHEPQNLGEQALILYAGTKGLLDDIPLKDVRRFEKEFLDFVHKQHEYLVKKIEENRDFNGEDEVKIKEVIGEFKKRFVFV
ncbi:MAG: F0F1 ATP synthase subunit alpha [Candidatus Omnitrophota bacterium]|nr:MAG: F0F1 ATP synthase subunit alpha [Candidatus Omnitrophota bacterium]